MTQHEIFKKYILGVNKGYANSLIVCSPAGYGKTELTLNTMKELGLVEGQHYRYYSNYITPLTLYQTLLDINHLESPKILILDDIESTLQDKKIVGLLKSALWETPDGKRKVCWLSNTYKIEEQTFNFTGRIIFLLNEINKRSAIINALKDRSLFFEMKLTLPDMFELMRQRAELPYQDIPTNKRREIVGFLEKVGSEKSNISLRTLRKAFNLYLLSPNSYQHLIQKIL